MRARKMFSAALGTAVALALATVTWSAAAGAGGQSGVPAPSDGPSWPGHPIPTGTVEPPPAPVDPSRVPPSMPAYSPDPADTDPPRR
ncbi:hypothetical protein [Jidongwangia harbinensis]|uniref:hypothetical protein n=1 Tax=Jidongwangia harbinensis TaxID=2878561 RepID=UPI001CD986C6|nr:hypothetical protein [Jidongwangia harbinensis]MCA2215988.1 hypothetical protein [Jidongwangia harbinensis]